MNCIQILNKSQKELKKFNIKNVELDCEILLSNVLKVTRENLLINLNKKLEEKEKRFFFKYVERRKKKEPIAYIIGYKDFWKKRFYVNKKVLIPRPDTEVLVEEALKFIPSNKSQRIMDVGTGSGCILLSKLLERKKCFGVGIDVSKEAIHIAKYNAKIQQLENRLKFFNANIDNICTGKYDFIVSNPPYINKNKIKYLEEDVRLFEPCQALDGGMYGTSVTEKLIRKSSKLLKKNGKMIIEIQSESVNKIKNVLKRNNFFINNISRDLSNKIRCIVCTNLG